MDSSERLRAAIETSVLCRLATVDADGQPNVSPKEIFCTLGREGSHHGMEEYVEIKCVMMAGI
jgi:predicted pyridoxine 5'-phosphate oxidase superfamily flavin-nucleotide-binding protein